MTRFGFGVTNQSESQVILDNVFCKGLKTGKMILQINGEDTEITVPFLEDKHVTPIIEYLETRHNTYGKYPLGEEFISGFEEGSTNYLKLCK